MDDLMMSGTHLKVYGGTPKGDETPLCCSCRHSFMLRGQRDNEERTMCVRFYDNPMDVSKLARGAIVSCNQYEDKNSPTKYDFELIAWRLSSDKKGNQIGFKDPRQFKALQEAGKISDTDDVD